MPQIQGLGPKEDNLCEMFFNRAKLQLNSTFIWTKKEHEWASHTWGDISNQVRVVASALSQRGITALIFYLIQVQELLSAQILSL